MQANVKQYKVVLLYQLIIFQSYFILHIIEVYKHSNLRCAKFILCLRFTTLMSLISV